MDTATSFRAIAVRELAEEGAGSLALTLVAGARGLENPITFPRIQKAALAVSGFVDALHPGRVQVLGSSEVSYLKTLGARRRVEIFRKICEAPVSCFVVTKGLAPPDELVVAAEAKGIPVFTTPLLSSQCIDRLQRYLDLKLAPHTTIHGNLLDLYGLGVLILGESGIGKSECALDLITRGHRLVSDDAVEIHRDSAGVLVGAGPELTRHHMEIRGLGVINIHDLFGISAIRTTKTVELVVELEKWEEGKAYDRLGLDEESYLILDTPLPFIRMPVGPGRNIAILLEVAARNHLLKNRGYHAAKQLVDKVSRVIAASRPAAPGPRLPRLRGGKGRG